MVLAVAVLVTRRVAVLARDVDIRRPVVVDMVKASIVPLSDERLLPGFPVRLSKLMLKTLSVPAEADMASMVLPLAVENFRERMVMLMAVAVFMNPLLV